MRRIQYFIQNDAAIDSSRLPLRLESAESDASGFQALYNQAGSLRNLR